ncbi:energy transducer TonB, partial [Rhodoblastus acidophilus]
MSFALLPGRTRLSLTGVSFAAHLLALSALAVIKPPPVVLAPLEIDLVPQGDYVVDTLAIAGDNTSEPAPAPASPVEPAEAPPEALAAPPPASAPSPEPATILADPDARRAELAAQEQQRLRREKRRQAAIEARRAAREEAAEEARQDRLREKRRRAALERREAMRQAAAHGGGSEAHRAGVADGAPQRAARASYGAIISAELNRHKIYPAAARARAEDGAVGVTFVVGGDGRIVSHSIISS